MNKALLALEDGTVFEGRSVGAPTQKFGEVVFNTSLTGYQEIFTDPSYCGQIVVLTNPQIGNYGSNEDDMQAAAQIEGLVVRDFAPASSNWRSTEEADAFLARQHIPIIDDIDTRALVRRLRSQGVMRGVLSGIEADPQDLVRMARQGPSMAGLDLASVVSTKQKYEWTDGIPVASPSEILPPEATTSFHVIAYDFGIKRDILRRLVQRGVKVTVVPANTRAEEVMGMKPDGVFLSNGPGDPEPLDYQAAQVRKLLGKTPIFGICLGQQVLGLALGGRTFKLKFGHRGGNHPVLNKVTNRVEITAQNHGFCVDPDSLPQNVDVTHVNLNDETLEGFRHRDVPAFSVQYHPEAAPGPHDSHYLFDDFIQLMNDWKGGAR